MSGRWDGDTAALRAQQAGLAGDVVLRDGFPTPLRTIAGFDVGFEDDGATTRAAAVLLDADTLAVIDQQVARRPTAMKPSLQLKLSQHLTLTPQLQQSIRLLQLSTLELEQELEKYLQENPLLEREEEEYAPAPAASTGGESTAEDKPQELRALLDALYGRWLDYRHRRRGAS